jgi:hypothetical protein
VGFSVLSGIKRALGAARGLVKAAAEEVLGLNTQNRDVLRISGAAATAARARFSGQGDKEQHAEACAKIAATYKNRLSWVLPESLAAAGGFGVSMAVGVVKEIVDSSPLNPEGTRDFSLDGDLGADLLGAVVGAGL